ncbi:MAG: phosphoribosylglycinamide formyltransferase [Chitinophagaceae bacterium]
MKKIAVFASGSGTNTAKIAEWFRSHDHIKLSLVVSNKAEAGVLPIAAKENIPALLIEKEKFFRGDAYVPQLKKAGIDFIVLAGFLWKIPAALLDAYPGKIINIHPALLPKYGGKGMYGQHVHAAVIAHKEKESGISIHYIDDIYDHGQLIFQACCPVEPRDTPETLAGRIQQLEQEHYARVIEEQVRKVI